MEFELEVDRATERAAKYGGDQREKARGEGPGAPRRLHRLVSAETEPTALGGLTLRPAKFHAQAGDGGVRCHAGTAAALVRTAATALAMSSRFSGKARMSLPSVSVPG